MIFFIIGGISIGGALAPWQRWALRKTVRKFRKLRKCAICVAHYVFFSALAQFALRSMPIFSALAQFALRSMPFFSALAQFAFANR